MSGFLTPVDVASALFFETPSEIFGRVHREIRPRTPLPNIDLEYKQFANADSRVRLENGAITVRITDLLEGAPAPVTEALAHILLGKHDRQQVLALRGQRINDSPSVLRVGAPPEDAAGHQLAE